MECEVVTIKSAGGVNIKSKQDDSVTCPLHSILKFLVVAFSPFPFQPFRFNTLSFPSHLETLAKVLASRRGSGHACPIALHGPEHWRSVFTQCETLFQKNELCQHHGILISYLVDESQRSKCTAGTILQRCMMKVEAFRMNMTYSLCVFKIGMTTNPLLRFHFYAKGNYSHMSLLHVTNNIGVAQMLEAALIQAHMSERQCRNEKLGGDGPPTNQDGHFFVYIVGARADVFKRIF